MLKELKETAKFELTEVVDNMYERFVHRADKATMAVSNVCGAFDPEGEKLYSKLALLGACCLYASGEIAYEGVMKRMWDDFVPKYDWSQE